MVIIIKSGASEEKINKLVNKIQELGVEARITVGVDQTIIGLVGDTRKIDPYKLENNEVVEKLLKVSEPFKLSNRKFHNENTIINVNDRIIGGKKLALIAGPCSVESESQILTIAQEVKRTGAGFLRGGAFKPRTSPYAFQGLELEGLELLKMARKETGLPIVTEIMSSEYIDRFVEDVDIIQVGARNMQNFPLLKELGKTKKTILLKRGLSATIEELLMSAEYIMAGGNENVILCERGIRTFETYTRNTLDISVIPAIKKLSHLPIIIDPSHAAGKSFMVDPLSKAAIAAGADGLIIEVHNDPENALCDGPQSITPSAYEQLINEIKPIAMAVGREI